MLGEEQDLAEVSSCEQDLAEVSSLEKESSKVLEAPGGVGQGVGAGVGMQLQSPCGQ